MPGKTQTITVGQVEALAEDQAAVMSMQARLRQAMFGAISESDVEAIVKKQVEKAKEGDEKSLQFVMKYALGCGQPVTLQQNLFVDTETAARLESKKNR